MVMRSSVMRAGIQRSDKGVFVAGISFIILFTIALMNSIVVLTTNQTIQGDAYNAAIIQLLTGIAGIGIGFALSALGIVKFEKAETEESLWSFDKGWIVWGIIGFTGIRLANFILQGIFIPAISLSMTSAEVLNIILSAGVFEDTLLSLGFCTALYFGWNSGLRYWAEKFVGGTMAILVGFMFVAVLSAWVFTAMHIGAGYTAAQLGYVFISRIVLCLVYLKSKNVMSPVTAHLLHNLFLFMFGI